MKGVSLKYAWLTSRRERILFPLAFAGLFVLALLVMRRPEIRFTLARAYLGFIVPLVGGILAAYAVLDDPALELRFATPAGAGRTLLIQVGSVLAVQAACALTFQLVLLPLHVDLSRLGDPLDVQLAWLVPAFALAALGVAGSLASAQTAVGAFLAGATWLVQVMMKSWLLDNARHLHLFMGVLVPGHPGLAANRAVIASAAAALLVLSWRLLQRQERFL